VAAAINEGLLMDPAEKIARHAKLYKVVASHTWAAVLVKMLLGQMGLRYMARQAPCIPKLEGKRRRGYYSIMMYVISSFACRFLCHNQFSTPRFAR
jgi:hypothetical protein